MFDFEKPTVQLLGRWQPWHKGHTELFKKALLKTGQVCIMIRSTQGKDNPLSTNRVSSIIKNYLAAEGFTSGKEYVIMTVPNIVDISYGRDVGYTFTEHHLGKDIHNISATKIRASGVLDYTEGTRMDSNYYYMKDPNDYK